MPRKSSLSASSAHSGHCPSACVPPGQQGAGQQGAGQTCLILLLACPLTLESCSSCAAVWVQPLAQQGTGLVPALLDAEQCK